MIDLAEKDAYWNLVHQVQAQNNLCHPIVAFPSHARALLLSSLQLLGLQNSNYAKCLDKSDDTHFFIRLENSLCVSTVSFISQGRDEYD